MAAPRTYTRSNVYKIPKGQVAFQLRRADGSHVEAVQCNFLVIYRESLGNPYGPQDARRAV